MSRQELRMGPVPMGGEASALAAALDRVEPDDLVVYHRGRSGSALPALKRAAMNLCERGLCYLTQRVTDERHPDGYRIVDYVMIKGRKR